MKAGCYKCHEPKRQRMLGLPERVTLKDVANDCDCDATIIRLDRKLAKLAVDGGWWKEGEYLSLRKGEGDKSWNWAHSVGECRTDSFGEPLGIQTMDGEVQGAMILWTDGKSITEAGKPSIFVQYLATAPWNREWLVKPPKFRGAGSALLFQAVCHSWNLGFDGRVTLLSNPSERTREFYKKRSLTQISIADDGMIEFELEPPAAQRWLRYMGVLP